MLDFLSNWKDKITQQVDLRIRLFKLEFIERTSNVLSYFIFTFVILLLTMAMMIFFGIGLGEWFSEMFHSRIGGYFATTAVYILLIVVIFALRKKFINAFSGIFIRVLTERKDDDDDDDDDDEQPKEKH
jgi:hypothetical protein